MSEIKLGNVILKHGLFLAPMAGVTDHSFRSVCRKMGAEYTVSEMISAKALCYEQKCRKKASDERIRTALLAKIDADESPMALQLFGCDPQFMAEAAKMLESGEYLGASSICPPAAIDINMGCPVHKVVSNGEGSALMKNPTLAKSIVEAVCRAVKIPVTVKIRSGWDEKSINAPEFAKLLEQSGAAAVFVHSRTRCQMYSGKADLNVISEVKRAVSIPVIGNGDIYCADDAVRMLKETDCDGIMVARGALGNPWIFSEIISRFENTPYIFPSTEEKMNTALCHLYSMISEKGERVAVAEGRKVMSWYIKGMTGSASARAKINSSESVDEIEETVKKLISEQ